MVDKCVLSYLFMRFLFLTFHVTFLTYLSSCLFLRLNSNSDIANRVAPEVVTKPETVTLEELFSYIKQDSSKV